MALFVGKSKKESRNDATEKSGKRKSRLRWLWKLPLWLLGIVLVVLILAVVFLNPIAKFAVNKVAPKVLGIDMHIDSVGISLFSGRVELNGFVVANPPDRGYKTEHAICLGHVVVDVDLRTVTKEKIVIEELTLRDINASYEGNFVDSNLQDLVNLLTAKVQKEEEEVAEAEEARVETARTQQPSAPESAEPSGSEQTETAEPKKEVLLQVDKIEFENVGVTTTIKGSETSVPITVNMRQRGPWGVDEGITPLDLTYNLIGAIVTDSFGSLTDAGVQVGTVAVEAITEVGDQALNQAGEALNQAGQSARKALDDAGLSGAGEAAGKALDDAGNALKSGLKGLGL